VQSTGRNELIIYNELQFIVKGHFPEEEYPVSVCRALRLDKRGECPRLEIENSG
jgi:hypothetical protein